MNKDDNKIDNKYIKFINIISFDIGEKNLACYCIKVNLNKLLELKQENIPFYERYDKNGEATPKFSKFLKKLTTVFETIFIGKADITSEDDKKIGKRRIVTNRMLVRLHNYLEDLNEQGIFNDIDYFLIERQLKKATDNLQLQMYIKAYFISIFLAFRPIICFPAYHKTRIFGAPKKVYNEKKKGYKKMTTYQRKKWASEKVFEILSNNNDFITLQKIYGKEGKIKKKSDDYSDCLLMDLAFLYIVFIDNKKDILDC